MSNERGILSLVHTLVFSWNGGCLFRLECAYNQKDDSFPISYNVESCFNRIAIDEEAYRVSIVRLMTVAL